MVTRWQCLIKSQPISINPRSVSSCVNNMTFSALSLYCQQHTAKRAILGISWKKVRYYGDLLVDKHVFRQHCFCMRSSGVTGSVTTFNIWAVCIKLQEPVALFMWYIYQKTIASVSFLCCFSCSLQFICLLIKFVLKYALLWLSVEVHTMAL